jgi:hypothetical protein
MRWLTPRCVQRHVMARASCGAVLQTGHVQTFAVRGEQMRSLASVPGCACIDTRGDTWGGDRLFRKNDNRKFRRALRAVASVVLTFTLVYKPAARDHDQHTFLRANLYTCARRPRRPARPRHLPRHLHRRHHPRHIVLTCARSKCMHSWRRGSMPPELPRRLVCCVRLWRCSLDATW